MASAPPPPLTATIRRLLTALASLGSLAFLGLYVARYGYYRIFSSWALYDDEGYVLQSVRSYLEGHRLYDEVFSQYGPAFYLLHSIGHAVGVPATHDATRLVTLVLWFATAAAYSAIVFRLTQSLVLAAATFVHTFVHIAPLINEPGHPETLLGLTVALGCLIVSGRQGTISNRHALLCGTLAAGALLTKINVGGYLFLGIFVPLVCAMQLPRFAGAAVVLFAAAVPLLVMRQSIADRSTYYAIVGAVSAAAAAIVCVRVLRPAALSRGVVVRYLAAAAATAAVIVSWFLIRGSSPTALADAILFQPLRLADVFYMHVDVSRRAALISFAALPLAALFTSRALLGSTRRSGAVFIAKIAFACGTLYASRAGYLEMMEYVTPFLWILVLPVDGQSMRELIARGVLAATATFEVLQGYPVGGTQVPFATLLMAPLAFICLHDAMRIVARHATGLSPAAALNVLSAAAFVWALPFYRPIMGPEVWHHYADVYNSHSELRLPGATRIRLAPSEVATLQWLTGTLQANCTAFVSVPGFPSLHAWTGIPPLITKNAGTWMTLLGEQDQARLWRAVDTAAAPCAVLNERVANNWLGARVETLPVYASLMSRFAPVEEVEGFRLLMPSGSNRRSDPLMQLVAGRQAFGADRPSLPVAAPVILRHPESTIRTWVRTERAGVILGCQAGPAEIGGRVHGGPLLYVSTTGKMYGQHLAAGQQTLSSAAPINDGAWHHVALTRSADRQSLYVDGKLAGTQTAPPLDASTMTCQAGTGFTMSWPEVRSPWMRYRGEIEGLAVAKRAWTEEDIARDLGSRPSATSNR